MLLATNIAEAIRSLYAAKQRTLLALICIMVGIGSVIAMITVGTIVKNESVERFKELGTDVFTIRKLRAGREGVEAVIHLSDVTNMPAQVPTVTAVAPWISTFGQVLYAGNKLADAKVLGVTAAFADLQKIHVVEGRFVSDLDFRRNYCVIGDEVAQAMRRVGVHRIVGKQIKVDGHMYTIIGVLGPVAQRVGMDMNQLVLVPITMAQRIFRNTEIQDIAARMSPNLHYSVVEKDVVTYFRSKSKSLKVGVESASQLIEQIQAQLQLITLLLGAIGSIALIIGGASVMNVMLTAVTERRKEIGIRRALGARRKDIQGQFLIEAIILSLFSSVFGVILGVGGSYALCQFTEWKFMIAPDAVVLGVGVASCIGIAFGFYPAWQAARLDPITAMRA